MIKIFRTLFGKCFNKTIRALFVAGKFQVNWLVGSSFPKGVIIQKTK